MSDFVKKYKIYGLICFISIIIGSLCAVAWGKFKSSRHDIPKEVLEVKTNINIKFPDFGVTKYSNTEKLDAYLSNRKVLLVIVSSSCGACKREIEVLKSANLLKDTDIEIVFVGFEKEEYLKEFLTANSLNIPIFDDRQSKIKERFNLEFTPTNFLIINGQLDRMWAGAPQTVEELYAKLGLSLK